MKSFFSALFLTTILLAGCGSVAPQPVVDEATTIEVQNLSLANENASVPLGARLSFNNSVPTTVEVTVNDGERSWNIPTSDEAATDYSLKSPVPSVTKRSASFSKIS